MNNPEIHRDNAEKIAKIFVKTLKRNDFKNTNKLNTEHFLENFYKNLRLSFLTSMPKFKKEIEQHQTSLLKSHSEMASLIIIHYNQKYQNQKSNQLLCKALYSLSKNNEMSLSDVIDRTEILDKVASDSILDVNTFEKFINNDTFFIQAIKDSNKENKSFLKKNIIQIMNEYKLSSTVINHLNRENIINSNDVKNNLLFKQIHSSDEDMYFDIKLKLNPNAEDLITTFFPNNNQMMEKIKEIQNELSGTYNKEDINPDFNSNFDLKLSNHIENKLMLDNIEDQPNKRKRKTLML